MNLMVITHGCYLVIGIATTLAVISTLERRGQHFVIRWWNDDHLLAASWNHLLTVGLYLLHIGALLLALRYGGQALTQTDAIELLSTKIGFVLLALAVTLFLHVKAYWVIHRALPAANAAVIDAEMAP
jgi:hypothetical protein